MSTPFSSDIWYEMKEEAANPSSPASAAASAPASSPSSSTILPPPPAASTSTKTKKKSKKSRLPTPPSQSPEHDDAIDLASPSGVVDFPFDSPSASPPAAPSQSPPHLKPSPSPHDQHSIAISPPQNHPQFAPSFSSSSSAATPSSLPSIAFDRKIRFNDDVSRMHPVEAQGELFVDNRIRTSRYTAYDFLPRNLFEQFSGPANCFFLFVGILQAIPAISTTLGVPTIYFPLLFILTVSAIRSAVEDYNRHKLDAQEGAKKYLVYDGHHKDFVIKQSADIVVGDIVKMQFGADADIMHVDDDGRPHKSTLSSTFPADLLFLSSSHEKGHCFVETASLDGECNLKIKNSIDKTQELLWVPPADSASSPSSSAPPSSTPLIQKLDLALDVEGPNPRFDSFKGICHIHTGGRNGTTHKVPLKADNLLLRGTELRNTAYILGLVVYTGSDTKLRRNVKTSFTRVKKSSLMTRASQLLVYMLAFQLILCFFSALFCFSWLDEYAADSWYLQFHESNIRAALKAFFTWFIILAQMVPISLLVSNELVKAAQATFIAWDLTMYDPTTDQPTVVRNSQLHEDLGQVEYIFSDKTGTLTSNKMEFRVGLIGLRSESHQFGSAESEIARRVAMRMEQVRQQQQQQQMAAAGSSSSSSSSSTSSSLRSPSLTWTERVDKLNRDAAAAAAAAAGGSSNSVGALFDHAEKDRMLTALWGAKGSQGPPANVELAHEIRTFLTHMAISNTITPELRLDGGREEYIFNFSSPDELALCKFAAHCGFQFQSRSQAGVQLSINKMGYGDDASEVELYQSLGILDFNSKRKRVTCIYLRGETVYVMCKGADANVFPLIDYASHPDQRQLRDTLERELNDMGSKGLRTLLVAGATLPTSWWFGDGTDGETNTGMAHIYKQINLPDRGAEKGHHRGECLSECRICKGLLEIELHAHMTLIGATAIEDQLQPLVPECIEDFIKAGIKTWMLTGDKRETAKNIGLACNLIDPDMENIDLVGSLSIEDMNRVIEITGDWANMTSNHDSLRVLFDTLDCAGDLDGHRTGYISREELRYYLIGLRVPQIDDDRIFDAQWAMVASSRDGRISFPEFARFMKNLQPTPMRSIQHEIELGLRKARLIAGDGTPEEKRQRLERTPISLVVEGEAFNVLFPDQTKHRVAHSHPPPPTHAADLPLRTRAIGMFQARYGGDHGGGDDDDDYSEPEVLLLRETFFELASLAKSVIACRLTPAQKGRIVAEFTNKGHVTLAIGDGGNDEVMIRRASIGVGISGLEGTAASRAADYAIAQFRFLHTLLFVHGQWCYRRISKLCLFIVYKASLVALSMWFFGFFSAFSGQQWFNDPIYLLFNIAFTALPIVIMAIFDQGGLTRDTLEDDPKAYLSISNGFFFNDRRFIAWVFRAAWNAVVIFGIVYSAVGWNDVSGWSGQNHGLWLTSTVVYTIVVMLCTFRIFFECQTLNIFIAGIVLFSFGCYFPIVLLCSHLQDLNPNLYGTFQPLFGDGLIWCVIIFGVLFPLLIDGGILAYNREYNPTYLDVLQERQRLSPSEKLRLDQEAERTRNAQTAAAGRSVRNRQVPLLTQQEKDEKLFAKIKAALEKTQQESSKIAGAGSAAARDAQRRAEALVFTMTRLQNLSGANFDATPQRNIMSLYEVNSPLTPSQQSELTAREERMTAETQKQHQLDRLREEQEEKTRQERQLYQRSQMTHADEPSLNEGIRSSEVMHDRRRPNTNNRRSSDSAKQHIVVGDDSDGDSDVLELSTNEHENSAIEMGQGIGRIHLNSHLMDEPDESVEDLEDIEFKMKV